MSTATTSPTATSPTADAGEPIDLAVVRRLAAAVRLLSADMVNAAASGHPGLPLGAADVATVLFTRHLTFDPSDARWPDRDRFVLSAGHGSALLYAIGYLAGVDGVELDHLRRFRQLGSPCAGHPEHGHFPIAETTTGPLGQGIANAVGMAIAEARLRAEFGEHLCNHRTFVLAGDGCLMEGITAEAIALAGHLRLDRLTVLWDDNRITIDGATALATSEHQTARFAAAGWHVLSVDGHDPIAIDEALTAARASTLPTLIACRTTIGYGAPTVAGTSEAHGNPLGSAERDAMAELLGWPHPPFQLPADALDGWGRAARRSAGRRAEWDAAVAADPAGPALLARIADPTPPGLGELEQARRALIERRPTIATRAANAIALEAITGTVDDERGHGAPSLLGGSADLSESNGLALDRHRPFTADDRLGNFVNYGIREHAMAAAMNGIALHGGFRTFGATFLAFSDYSRPAIRLAALMGLDVVHVFTHDSIGVGEDGPTHQPVEQVCALRAIPGLDVVRPADAVETIEAWRLALSGTGVPTAIVLTRQAVDAVPRSVDAADGVALGGYPAVDPPDAVVTLMASGSEVGTAIAAAVLLAEEGVVARVVSMPCMERFSRRPAAERALVLGEWPRVAVEATVGQSWQRWLRPGDRFVGMTGFGASGRAAELFEHFGITPGAVAAAALDAVRAHRTRTDSGPTDHRPDESQGGH